MGARPLFCKAVLAMAASVVIGQAAAAAETFRAVDLDGRAPAERVYSSEGVFHVLIWNPDRQEWIDVFRSETSGDALEVGPVKAGSLADLEVGDQKWGWRDANYVRLPNPPAETGYPPADVAALAYKAVGSRASPDTAGGFAFSEPDGTRSWFVIVNDAAACSSWLCPGVVVRNGVAARDIGAIAGDLIGPSDMTNAQGHRMIEQIKDGETLVMDPDDVGVETAIIPGMEVRIADPQPLPPEE